ncbi:MAG: ABC transporter ATP-binding protein, partial [Chlamydiae bacterium]|nr:ABC transporter ATP-binding protein [Chlamydiota bacterium]
MSSSWELNIEAFLLSCQEYLLDGTMFSMNFQNVYSFIWCFVKRQPWGFALLFFTSLAMAVDILFWPYFLRCFVDILSQTSETRSVVLSLLFPLLGQGIFFLVLVEAGFRYRGFLQSRVFPTMEAQIRMTMFEHVQKHSPAYFTEHFTGTLANKISDMTTHVTSSFFYLLIFFPTVVTATFALIILWKIHSFFALILLIWVLLCIGICAVFLPKCVHYAHVHGDVRSTLAGKMLDSLTNYLSVNL